MRGRSDDPEIYRWKRTIASLVSLSRSSRLASVSRGGVRRRSRLRVSRSIDAPWTESCGVAADASLPWASSSPKSPRRLRARESRITRQSSLADPRSRVSPTLGVSAPHSRRADFPRRDPHVARVRASRSTPAHFSPSLRAPPARRLPARVLPSRASRRRAPIARRLASRVRVRVFASSRLRVSRAHLSAASSSPTWLSRSL